MARCLTAKWQPWQDDDLPHLIISLTNSGGETAYVGPGGRDITITGPLGTVPIDWGSTGFARPIHGGVSVNVGFHPRSVNGTFALAIDHAHPHPMDPARGAYIVCLESDCTRADLR